MRRFSRGAGLLLLATLTACGEPEAPVPEPRYVDPLPCTVRSFESTDGRTVTARVRIENTSRHAIAMPGVLTLGIQHTNAQHDQSFVCSGTSAIDASSFVAGPEEGVLVTVTLDSPCPPPPPGSTVLVRVDFRRDGALSSLGCTADGMVPPAVFGGGGLDYEGQRRALALEGVASSPDFAAVRAYADRLAAVVAALPPVATAAEHPCAGLSPDVEGPLLMATDAELASIGAPSQQPLRTAAALDAYAAEAPLASRALEAAGRLLHAGEGEPGAVRRWIEAHTPYVAVVQTRSITWPEEHGGSQESVHTYTPGTFVGVASLVDTRDARVLCSTSFTASSAGDFEQTTRDGTSVTSQMRQSFTSGNLTATFAAIRELVPTATAGLAEPPAL